MGPGFESQPVHKKASDYFRGFFIGPATGSFLIVPCVALLYCISFCSIHRCNFIVMQRYSSLSCQEYMKCLIILLALIVFAACSNNGQLLTVPVEPEHVWIDQATGSDTIITGEGYTIPNYLYYAAQNWQTSADTNLTHGYRKITIRFGDSILVNPLADLSTNYDGPFFFHTDESKTSLQAQNFIDTTMPNEVRIFILLR